MVSAYYITIILTMTMTINNDNDNDADDDFDDEDVFDDEDGDACLFFWLSRAFIARRSIAASGSALHNSLTICNLHSK